MKDLVLQGDSIFANYYQEFAQSEYMTAARQTPAKKAKRHKIPNKNDLMRMKRAEEKQNAQGRFADPASDLHVIDRVATDLLLDGQIDQTDLDAIAALYNKTIKGDAQANANTLNEPFMRAFATYVVKPTVERLTDENGNFYSAPTEESIAKQLSNYQMKSAVTQLSRIMSVAGENPHKKAVEVLTPVMEMQVEAVTDRNAPEVVADLEDLDRVGEAAEAHLRDICMGFDHIRADQTTSIVTGTDKVSFMVDHIAARANSEEYFEYAEGGKVDYAAITAAEAAFDKLIAREKVEYRAAADVMTAAIADVYVGHDERAVSAYDKLAFQRLAKERLNRMSAQDLLRVSKTGMASFDAQLAQSVSEYVEVKQKASGSTAKRTGIGRVFPEPEQKTGSFNFLKAATSLFGLMVGLPSALARWGKKEFLDRSSEPRLKRVSKPKLDGVSNFEKQQKAARGKRGFGSAAFNTLTAATLVVGMGAAVAPEQTAKTLSAAADFAKSAQVQVVGLVPEFTFGQKAPEVMTEVMQPVVEIPSETAVSADPVTFDFGDEDLAMAQLVEEPTVGFSEPAVIEMTELKNSVPEYSLTLEQPVLPSDEDKLALTWSEVSMPVMPAGEQAMPQVVSYPDELAYIQPAAGQSETTLIAALENAATSFTNSRAQGHAEQALAFMQNGDFDGMVFHVKEATYFQGGDKAAALLQAAAPAIIDHDFTGSSDNDLYVGMSIVRDAVWTLRAEQDDPANAAKVADYDVRIQELTEGLEEMSGGRGSKILRHTRDMASYSSRLNTRPAVVSTQGPQLVPSS